MVYQIRRMVVTNKSKLNLQLAPGGGAAVSFKMAEGEERKK